jgi:hypothetical protein
MLRTAVAVIVIVGSFGVANSASADPLEPPHLIYHRTRE